MTDVRGVPDWHRVLTSHDHKTAPMRRRSVRLANAWGKSVVSRIRRGLEHPTHTGSDGTPPSRLVKRSGRQTCSSPRGREDLWHPDLEAPPRTAPEPAICSVLGPRVTVGDEKRVGGALSVGRPVAPPPRPPCRRADSMYHPCTKPSVNSGQ